MQLLKALRLRLVFIGKTDDGPIRTLMEDYISRLGHYVSVKVETIELSKAKIPKEPGMQSAAEGKLLLEILKHSERVILLDEQGKKLTSRALAETLQKTMNSGLKELTFVIGGAYGFSEEVRSRFQEKLSLSPMTFTHQMVRPILVEQLYRAFSIINNGRYHH